LKNLLIHPQYIKNLRNDIPAGLVVFLVAVPLCLGISLASGAPFSSGLLAGIIGGLVVSLISGSQLSVSGPAAGLTAVVLTGIETVGSFEAFLVTVVLAGIIQIALGMIRAGVIAYFFPSSVITGMLAAIGVILILKQFPHAVGYDIELMGQDRFEVNENENTLTLFIHALEHLEWAALIISLISLSIIVFWEKTPLRKLKWMPSALVVVVIGTLINQFLVAFFPAYALEQSHLVTVPTLNGEDGLLGAISNPDFTVIDRLGFSKILVLSVTIALIASVETLLTIEAVDKLDPRKRKSPLNKELIAQGIGNTIGGLVGALPLTSVIVRSSANINSGGVTKMAAFFHGIFMLVSVLFLANFLNMIPFACLAAILIQVGYKLAKPSLFKAKFKAGYDQFIPFVVTIVAILLTDLLIGISIGIVIGLIFVVRTNLHTPVSIEKQGNFYVIRVHKDLSFLNKPLINKALESIPEQSNLMIDGTKADFIDNDIMEAFEDFQKEAKYKNISVVFKNVDSLETVSGGLVIKGSNPKFKEDMEDLKKDLKRKLVESQN
jgi:MFS superfamily sulfate permease-like transporter